MRLAALIQLQTLDGRIHALRREQENLPRGLAAVETRVAKAREAAEAFKQQLKKSRVDVDRRELELKTLEGRIQQLEGQLNQSKTNKEYAILKKEIDGFRADKGKLDDDILQMFAAYETREKEGQGLGEQLAAAEAELAESRRKIDGELATIGKELAELEAKRKEAREAVSADDKHPGGADDVLKTYERIQKAKQDGQALVPVVDGVCQGCYMDLTSQEVNLLLMGRKLITCRSCSRILYIAKEPAATVTEPKK